MLYPVEKSIFVGEIHHRFAVGEIRDECFRFGFGRNEVLENIDRVNRQDFQIQTKRDDWQACEKDAGRDAVLVQCSYDGIDIEIEFPSGDS